MTACELSCSPLRFFVVEEKLRAIFSLSCFFFSLEDCKASIHSSNKLLTQKIGKTSLYTRCKLTCKAHFSMMMDHMDEPKRLIYLAENWKCVCRVSIHIAKSKGTSTCIERQIRKNSNCTLVVSKAIWAKNFSSKKPRIFLLGNYRESFA